MEYSIFMKEINWINNLKSYKILLFIWEFSPHSLQFQVMDKGIMTFLQFLNYKFIAIIIFKELASVKFYNARSLTDSPDTYFPDGFRFIGAQWKFENRFPFFHKIFYSEDNSTNSNSYNIKYFTKFFPLQHDTQCSFE